MTEDLAEWLRAQLDEDERIARAASGDESWGSASWEPELFGDRPEDPESWGQLPFEEDPTPWVCVRHAARHDPARVLREIDAKRRLLEALLSEGHAVLRPGGSTQVYCDAEYGTDSACECGRDERVSQYLRVIALPYADRPGYRDEWRP